jgi:hypothetical protein
MSRLVELLEDLKQSRAASAELRDDAMELCYQAQATVARVREQRERLLESALTGKARPRA